SRTSGIFSKAHDVLAPTRAIAERRKPCYDGDSFYEGERVTHRSLQDHFLIAMPAMADPNFSETVTYICKHDAEGAFGVIVNRPGDLSLAEMLGQLSIPLTDRSRLDHPVLVGGPVEPERGFVLHRSSQNYGGTLAAGGDIKVTVSLDILAALGRG